MDFQTLTIAALVGVVTVLAWRVWRLERLTKRAADDVSLLAFDTMERPTYDEIDQEISDALNSFDASLPDRITQISQDPSQRR